MTARGIGVAAWLFGALVACSGNATVVYDSPDAAPWSSGHGSGAPHLAGGVALVSELGSDSVSLLDLAGGTTLATVPVGIVPLSVNGPHDLAVDVDGRAFFTPLTFPPPVLLPGPHAAHGSSATPGILVKRSLDDFALMGQAQVDPNPGDVVLSPDRRTVYVSHFDLARAVANPGDRSRQLSSLAVIRADTMQVLAMVPVCIAGHEMNVSDDGRTLYVACYGDDAVAVVDVSVVPPVPTLVPLGAAVANGAPVYGPYALARSPDGRTVWVVTQPPNPSVTGDGVVFALDTATRRVDLGRTLPVRTGRPFFPDFSPDGSTLYLPVQNRDGVQRVSLTVPPTVTQQVAFTADQCLLPHRTAVGPDGRIYVLCEGHHGATAQSPSVVVALAPDTLAVVARFPVGIDPEDIAFLP